MQNIDKNQQPPAPAANKETADPPKKVISPENNLQSHTEKPYPVNVLPPATNKLPEKRPDIIPITANVKNPKRLDFYLFAFILTLCLNIVITLLFLRELPVFLDTKARKSLEKLYDESGISESTLKKLSVLNTAFPNEKKVIDFVTQMNKLESQFRTFSFKFDADELKTGELKYLPFTIRASGEHNAVLSLLIQLSEARESVEIQIFNISSSTGPETEILISAHLFISDAYPR